MLFILNKGIIKHRLRFVACVIFIPLSTAYCTDGQVRLVDGDTDVEGRVEICFNWRWGTISGDGWTQTESTVVCNDLGYEPTGEPSITWCS